MEGLNTENSSKELITKIRKATFSGKHNRQCATAHDELIIQQDNETGIRIENVQGGVLGMSHLDAGTSPIKKSQDIENADFHVKRLVTRGVMVTPAKVEYEQPHRTVSDLSPSSGQLANSMPLKINSSISIIPVAKNSQSGEISMPQNHASLPSPQNHASLSITQNPVSLSIPQNSASLSITQGPPSLSIPQNHTSLSISQNHASFSISQNHCFTTSQNYKSFSTQQKHAPLPTQPIINISVIDLSREKPKKYTPAHVAMQGNLKTKLSTYMCELCDKSFCRADELTYHLRSHRGSISLPHTCKFCKAQYTTKRKLALHHKTFHQKACHSPEMALPVVDLNQAGVKEKLSSLGVRHFLVLSQLQSDLRGLFGLPIISVDGARNPAQGNLGALGATKILSLGPLRNI